MQTVFIFKSLFGFGNKPFSLFELLALESHACTMIPFEWSVELDLCQCNAFLAGGIGLFQRGFELCSSTRMRTEPCKFAY